MKRTFIFFVTVLPLFVLSGCSQPKEKEAEKPPIQTESAPVGRVDKVNKAAGYVFIRRYRSLKLDDNDVLEARGSTDGVRRSANLDATGEKLGEHVAADIRSGDVQVGDSVFIRKIENEEEPEITLDPIYRDKKSTFLDN
ncbi:hypothetical protein OAI07_00105 [Akkermansiaceae bacterium]|nr:hypothetical protein [Akkermansiaceae bacterium]